MEFFVMPRTTEKPDFESAVATAISICRTGFASRSSLGFPRIKEILRPYAEVHAIKQAIALCGADTISPRFAYPHIESLLQDALTCGRYAASFLLSLLEGISIPNAIDPGEFCDVEIAVRDGWKVDVFYDCGELDYINHFISPLGEVIDFWLWPESEDRSLLINWCGH